VKEKEESGHVKEAIEALQLLPEGEIRESVKPKVVPKKAVRMKRELEILERELNHLIKIQWTYAKRMLKFGVASWIFGVSVFFLAIVILCASLLERIPPISISLLTFAAAVPILITAVRIRRFDIIIKRQECMRGTLLAGYQRAILKRIVGLVGDIPPSSDTPKMTMLRKTRRKITRYGDEK
jgi:hypothetical protein